jgi:hypothetical protein
MHVMTDKGKPLLMVNGWYEKHTEYWLGSTLIARNAKLARYISFGFPSIDACPARTRHGGFGRRLKNNTRSQDSGTVDDRRGFDEIGD